MMRRAHDQNDSASAGKLSPPNFSAPVTFGTPSSRTGDAPTAWPACGQTLVEQSPACAAHALHHRRDDLAVAGAAAEHAAERVLDLGFGRLRIAFEQRRRRRPAGLACRCRIAPRHARGRRPAAPTACRWRDLRRSAPSGPRADAAGTRQAQTGSPSRSTVQAPQSPASQPTLVPVSRSSSRSTADSRVTGWNGDRHRRAVHLEGDRMPMRVHAATVSRVSANGLPRPMQRARHDLPRGLAPIFGACRARRRSAQVRRNRRLETALGDCRPRPQADAAPPPGRPAACATAEQEPTAIAAASHQAILADGNPRRGHGDRDDEIAPRAELLEGRRAARPRLFGHADRRHHLVRPQAPCGGCRG